MKNNLFYTAPITKPKIKEHLSNFGPYKACLQLKEDFKLIEQEVFTEIYNKLAARIGQINYPEPTLPIPQISQEAVSITKAFFSCLNIKKALDSLLPSDEFDALYIYPDTYKKIYDIEIDVAKKVLLHAQKKQEFQLTPEKKNSDGKYNTNEVIEKLIAFCMLHLQSPIGTSDIVQDKEISTIKNEIYQTISKKIVEPFVEKCFKIILQESDISSIDPTDLFDTIMVFVSDYRGRIAHMQADSAALDMGEFTRTASMGDPLDNPSWQPWKEKIAEKIQKAIISDSREITLDYKQQSMCLNLKWQANMLKGVLHHKDDFTDSNPANTHSACYHFVYKQPLSNESIVPQFITCVHKKFEQNQISTLGEDIKNILLVDKSHLPVNGSKLFSTFLWDISGDSLLMRGQAAVTQFIMKGLANAKGYNLSWSKEWTPPAHPNYDMQALSVFYKDTFIEEHSHNIILSEIVPVNLAGILETSIELA
jgi:hypothetical protein